jgi:hypothetical protein
VNILSYHGGGGGGAGNDGGTVNTGCCSGSPSQVVGSNGTGGLLILIVDGALTFGGSSTLSSAGADGGAGGVCTDSTGGQGGGSGGGVIKYFYGSKTGTPTTNVTGGALNGCSGTVTATLMSIPVINNDTDSYNFGAIAPIESYTTGLDYFTLTNTGIVNIDVFIDGTDMIGSGCTTMTLSNIGVADNNTYGLMTGLEGTDYDIIVRRNPYYSVLKWNLGYASENNTQKWGLKLIAPTAYTGACAGGLSGNVTLSATVH